MYNFFKLKTDVVQHTQNLYAKKGCALLNANERTGYLIKIKRLLSITDPIWEAHYLYAIHRFCELVQDVPGSELHHHNYNGGLIDHTLETLYVGIKASHGFVIPPDTNPECISCNADKWRFGVFITLLAHDIGKIVTDIEFVYKANGQFVKWHPWNGIIPFGSEYTYRYKKRNINSSVGKSLHEKCAMSLLPQLLTKEAGLWLFSDPELFAQVCSTITHSAHGGEVIAKITQMADMNSVSTNMGGQGGTKDSYETFKRPFHEKLLGSLRKLANDGSLKRNKPGAALWITEDYTWVVSKVGMEAVREQLLDEGHKSIPRNVLRFFSELNENGLIIKTKNGDSVWKAEVNDMQNSWTQKLTFLKFENNVLWPTNVPALFDGCIIADDEINEKEVNDDQAGEGAGIQKISANKIKPPISASDTELTTEKTQNSNEKENPAKKGKKKATTAIKKVQSDPLEIDFFTWLISRIQNYKIRVNEKTSVVHFTDNYMILVTPAIFLEYLTSNPLKRRIYTSKAGNKKPYTALQREIESLAIHRRSITGENIVNIAIKGIRRKSSFKGYALNRENFPQLASFSANNVISIE